MALTESDLAKNRDVFISGRDYECVSAWHGVDTAYMDSFASDTTSLGTFVDIGCGRSPFLPELVNRQPNLQNLVALDVVPENVELVVAATGNSGQCRGIVGSVLDLNEIFGNESVGGITGTFVLPYWSNCAEDSVRFCNELVDVLMPGGRALIAPLFLQPGPSALYHIRKFNLDESEANKYIGDLRNREKVFVDMLHVYEREGRVSLIFREASELLQDTPIAQEPSKMEVDNIRYPHWFTQYAVGLAVEIKKLL